MNARDNFDGAAPAIEFAPEIRLRARAVSRGVAVGRIVCLYGTHHQYFRIDLDESEVPNQIKRLRSAISLAKRQLARIASRKSGRISDSGPGIFESHLMLIEDSSLQEKFEREITEHRVNAEWAIKVVTETYVAKYKAIEDEHLRDRYIDIEDVSDRILAALGGGSNGKLPFAKNSIIAARELMPSTLVELAENNPQAVLTENGGWTSHTFILAREMDVPAVTGIRKLLRRVKTGDQVIVDGYNGQVILNPSPETLNRYTDSAAQFHEATLATEPGFTVPVKTLDGKEIKILANSDAPSAYTKAKSLGAQGIGLYRSEFLFSHFHGVPTESEQLEAYISIADAAGEDGVRIRTFDLGADQLLDQNVSREKNPALGLRAIRIGLGYRKMLRTQLRALLLASFNRKISIVIPMVSGISEIRAVKQMIGHESAYLKEKGKDVGTLEVGAMIEVPSAVLLIDELVKEIDFICLGTNDLIQYLLAVDRDNEAVANWFRTLHPAVLKAIRIVLDAAAKAGKPAIVCGEMAGSPYYAPALIGLGATMLSMNVHSIPRVRKVIAGIALEEAKEMIAQIEKCATVEETEDLASRHIQKRWGHLFPPGFMFTT